MTNIFKVFGYLSATALLLTVAAPQALWGQFECKQELMAGAWEHYGQSWIQERETPDIFLAAGPAAATGLAVFDEQGKAVVFKQTNSTSVGANELDFVPVFDTQVTINPDCTGKITQSLREDLPPEHPLIANFGYQPGEVVFEFAMVCSNGQRECQATFTKPAGVIIGIVNLKRIDPASAATAADLGSIKANVEALTRRLGIVPQE